MENLEQAETDLKERADEITSLNSDREARLKTFDEETLSQSEQLLTARTERDRLFANLPKPMSAQYARISARIRDGIAVAEPQPILYSLFHVSQASGDDGSPARR